ncbi:MAG: bifunctional [glutamine synthetase] adenylyltransferase/[glutamine synthetase]-adenylyl-L-tyrosine phosphorylase [Jatrophihabitans sp.]
MSDEPQTDTDADEPEPVDPRVAARFRRLSFADGVRAAQILTAAPLNWWSARTNEPTSDAAAVVVAALARSADPDAALEALATLLADPRARGLRDAVMLLPELRARLLGLLGVSAEIAAHLIDNPTHWEVLLDDLDSAGISARLCAAVGADPTDPVTGTGGTAATVAGVDAVIALRTAYRREVVAIAGRDVAGDLDVKEVTELLADLAGHTVQAALAVARAALPEDAAPCRLAVIAMGKTGSRELNYVSDVDVVFVGEPVADRTADGTGGSADDVVEAALGTACRLAADLMRLCKSVAWEVDPNLRPEGKNGPLVRTLASHEAYYRRWAKTWEFQALLKARPIAGDLDLGRSYSEVISPLVWTAAERPDFVPDVRAMRARVVKNIPVSLASRDIKLGQGGIRDVEFAVQLLQMVHGRGDETLRQAETLLALEALRDGGYVGRDDAVSLIDAYRFLRTVEHRLQLRRLRRTHVLPEDVADLGWLARSMGYRPDHRGQARDVFDAEWDLHVREVRRLHEKLFYRPLLESVAKVPANGLRLTTAEAGRRLAALGFDNPDAALRHIESLTEGVSRRAALQRTLLPVLLEDFADAANADSGLLAYRTLSDELSSTPWYLRLLRDGDAVVSHLAYILGTSKYVAPMLGRAPEALQLLGSREALRPRDPAEILAAMHDTASRHDDPVAAIRAIRGIRRQELLRTAFADLLGLCEVTEVCTSLSNTLEATLEAALRVATRAVAQARGLEELPIRFAVIAMGRLGGAEVGYGSDADVMFVHESTGDDDELAGNCARDVAGKLRSLLGAASSIDPPLVVDADLRPEGRNGALVRSLASYRAYYARWSSAWEAQALLRARPVAGDTDLGRRFVEMIDPVRYPDGGVASEDLREIRRLKGRIDSERLPRNADPTTHTKLGRGGLADIEWTVQLLQLDHGHAVPELRTTRTLDALAAATAAGLLRDEQAATLEAAWRLATRVRNAMVLVRDKLGDQLPTQGPDLVGISRVLGYQPGSDPGQLVDDYRRAARRARRVVEEVFYGPS